MAAEYEWKFRVTPEEMETLQAAFPGEEIAMETTYYDTPSGSVWATDPSTGVSVRRLRCRSSALPTARTSARAKMGEAMPSLFAAETARAHTSAECELGMPPAPHKRSA